MPSKQVLAKMDPHDNPLVIPEKKPKKEKKKKPILKDLDGEIIEQEDSGNDMDQSEQDMSMAMDPDNNGFNIANSLANDMFNEQQREKSYTLTIICDPDEAGIDKKYLEYQRWLVDHHSNTGYNKPKRLVINANQSANGS